MKPTIQYLIAIILLAAPLPAQKFYNDDPLTAEPPPLPTEAAGYRSLNELYEMFTNSFSDPGERHPANGVIPAQGVSTLGEVLDGPWFTNRHARKRLTTEELLHGSGVNDPPSFDKPWRVLTVKKYDVRPGLLIHDADNTLYLLRFDPPGRLELSTGAGMIGSRLYHALGYWVAENYLVHFERSQLVAAPEGKDINAVGDAKQLMEEDIHLFLAQVPRHETKGYRAVAIKAPVGSELLGPYQLYGLRSDDPNDVVAHEHRRDLRGLHVISAWTGNNWVSATNSQDVLLKENDVYFIRHYLVEFFTTLGSSLEQPKHAREGNETFFDFTQTAKNFAGFGFYVPKWQRASYPGIRSVGLFEHEAFDPAKWTPNYDSAALANHLPDDDYWAAKQILAFTDDDIRIVVKAAEYSDPRAEEWIARCLIERRHKIGRYFLEGVLPLDNFRIENGRLAFDDLSVKHGFRPARDYSVEWAVFRNFTQEHQPIAQQTSWQIPERAQAGVAGSYYSAKISSDEPGKTVTVYLRKENDGFTVVGIDRDWPGKVIAEEAEPPEELQSVYTDLDDQRRQLFNTYVADYNKKTGFNVTPEDAFKALSISERTTFDAVTHALMRTKLTDESGNSLGNALDRLTGIERIAGQYYGRQGDEQFRLYVTLKPDTRDVLEKSQEFHFGHENTVYHVGYPHSYRQTGKVPNMQFSISEDGLRADIDVDYRSSKTPNALWNGHLTSANSDVRAGNNYERHNNRWSGLVNWWQKLFGDLPEADKDESDLLARKPPETATPLPPDRPANAPITEVYDAVQELLTDWLVRRKYDEAMTFVSDQALACVNLDDDVEPESLTPQQTRDQLRKNMEAISEQMGRFDNLTEAIDVLVPWRKAFQVVEHPYSKDFSVVRAPDLFAKAFACQTRTDERVTKALSDPNPQYGNYYGAMFRFKVENDRGGALGLLWTKENGAWRLVSWEVYEQ